MSQEDVPAGMRVIPVHIRVGPQGEAYAVTGYQVEDGTTLSEVADCEEPHYDVLVEVVVPEPLPQRVAARITLKNFLPKIFTRD